MDFKNLKARLESLGYGVTCFDTADAAADYLDENIQAARSRLSKWGFTTGSRSTTTFTIIIACRAA